MTTVGLGNKTVHFYEGGLKLEVLRISLFQIIQENYEKKNILKTEVSEPLGSEQ